MPDDDSLPLPEDLVIPDDLSALLDGAIGTTDMPSQIGKRGVISVIAAIDLTATAAPYITEVQPTDDLSISLPYDKAVEYGMAVLAAAHRAHYFAAVLAQTRHIIAGRGPRTAGNTVEVDESARLVLRDLIQDLPELDEQATAPLRFLPIIRRVDGRPMVRVSLPPHTEAITGWTFAEALHHAHAVLGQAIVSQLDTAYRTVISVTFGAGEQRGRAAVGDLGNYFWDKPMQAGYTDPTDTPEAQMRRVVDLAGGKLRPPDPRKARPTGRGKPRKR